MSRKKFSWHLIKFLFHVLAAIEKSKMSKTLEEAKASCTPVLQGSFFNSITSSTSREEFISKITEMKISPWDSDVMLEKLAPFTTGFL